MPDTPKFFLSASSDAVRYRILLYVMIGEVRNPQVLSLRTRQYVFTFVVVLLLGLFRQMNNLRTRDI